MKMLTQVVLAAWLSAICTAGDEREPQLARLVEVAAEYTLTLGEEDSSLTRMPQPVLRYSNPIGERGSSDGAVMLWTVGERPVVAACLSIRRPNSRIVAEFSSLSAQALICRRDSNVVWTPSAVEEYRSPVPDVDSPAMLPILRLGQMRDIAQDLVVTTIHPRTDSRTELRLLPKPLYRFSAVEEGVLDGALFAYVDGNAPQAIILVAAHADANGEHRWVSTFQRMSSLALDVRRDDILIQKIRNYYRNGDRLSQPYREHRTGRNYEPASAEACEPS